MESAGDPAAPEKLRICGMWTGVLEVRLDTWTASMLRAEVARRSAVAPECISLICGGKVLREGDELLSVFGVRNNSKVLATQVAADRGKAVNDEAAAAAAVSDRSQRLARLRNAAMALAGRHADDGSLPLEDFNIDLEDQNGQKVIFKSESDKKGVMVGLMLHTNARSLLKNKNYKDALDVLSMGEEAFSLCDPKFMEMIDNVPILQLDIVWCYFMLRDISCLSVAGRRLEKARKGFERSHGKDSGRFRLLQAGRHAELATYLRLELLEGVVAYHTGKLEEARKALDSANAKYDQLQVTDDAVSMLMDMGYKEPSVKRALRMSGQDVQSAVDFLIEERATKIRKHHENLERKREIMELKTYGMTPQNKAVDLLMLKRLVSIGYERRLAAEALRLNENDFQKALDLLTDPEENCHLQRLLHARRRTPATTTSSHATPNLPAAFSGAHVESYGDQVATAVAAAADAADAVVAPPVAAEGSPGSDGDGGRDREMEDELVEELSGDAFSDYDIDVSKEGEAIKEYLNLLNSVASASH